MAVGFFELMSVAIPSFFFAKNILGRGKLFVADHEHCGSLQQLHQVLAIPEHVVSRPRKKVV